MTTDDLAAYYANLLILQYLQKPNAYALVKATVKPVLMDQLPIAVQNAFNLTGTTAVGVQLDTIGKYLGVTRSSYGFSGPITLNDADFLTFIKMALVRNTSGSSLATIQLLLNRFFQSQIYIFDYQNMQLGYLIDTTQISSGLLNIFLAEKLLPKPMGVSISVVAAPVINKFFGFTSYKAPVNPLAVPFNSYSAYNSSWLWLSYQNGIIIT